jgi:hypothetical protein
MLLLLCFNETKCRVRDFVSFANDEYLSIRYDFAFACQKKESIAEISIGDLPFAFGKQITSSYCIASIPINSVNHINTNAISMRQFKFLFVTITVFVCCFNNKTFSQNAATNPDKELSYTRTINERAAKIVATLGIADSIKANRVKMIIANEYRSLNEVHTYRNDQTKAVKSSGAAKDVADAKVKGLEDEANTKIDQLHTKFIAALAKELTSAQVDKVKDGMTYDLVHVTYNAYMEEIPRLTEEQKKQILAWLIEAREHAMDAESSEKKHGWFGKYKGRINNYLSAAGYDLKKEGAEWEKRRNAAKESKTTSN